MLKIVTLAILLVLASAAPLLNLDGPTVIPGSYIVVLKDGLGIRERDAHIAALRDHIIATDAEDSEVTFIYGIGTFMGYAARMSKKLLSEQLSHPNIKYIEADHMASIDYIQEPHVDAAPASITQIGATWGISRVCRRTWPTVAPFPDTYLYNTTAGEGVDVYVLDTGILPTHVDFGGRATALYTNIAGEANVDLNGHGTHCAGTIGGASYGVAKSVNLKAVKVLSASGSGAWSGVIDGIDFVTKSIGRPSVASMSLGGGFIQSVNDAVTASVAKGVFYAIAAGNNNGLTCSFSPASATNAFAVGATQNNDARASFSNYGTCTKAFAPGVNIVSDWIGSNTATNTISGTSMACPHVAGIAALLLSGNIVDGASLPPADVTTWLVNGGTKDIVTNPGTGSPNVLVYSAPTGN